MVAVLSEGYNDALERRMIFNSWSTNISMQSIRHPWKEICIILFSRCFGTGCSSGLADAHIACIAL